MEPGGTKKSKKGLVAALCVLAVVIVAGTAGFLVWSGQKPPPRRPRANGRRRSPP